VRFLDVNMGLLGLELASASKPGWCCVGRVLDSSLVTGLYERARNTPSFMSDGSPQLVAGYFEHRELVLWASNPGRIGRVGDVVEHISSTRSRAAIIVSTRSALTAQKGYAFLRLVAALAGEGFGTCWLRVGAVDHGIPHDAHYTMVVAARIGVESQAGDLLMSVCRHLGLRATLDCRCMPLEPELDLRRPRLGLSRSSFGGIPPFAYLAKDGIHWCSVTSQHPTNTGDGALRAVVAPRLRGSMRIQAVRLVSRRGVTGVAVKSGSASYAMGPGTSACPLFAVRRVGLSPRARERALEYSNWSTERDGWLVWRLRPSRAVLLHGPDTAAWEGPLTICEGPLQKQYALVAQGCPPSVLMPVAEAVSHFLGSRKQDRAGIGCKS
jgi:hypothetical protein